MSLFDLTGKVAVVTGGNGGIGLGMARGLAQAGARVALVGRDRPKTEAAVREVGGDALAVIADVSSEEQAERSVAEVLSGFGRLDILVNNAGVIVRKPPQEVTLDEWNTVLGVNLTGAFLMAKAVYKPLQEAGGGKIINIGSIASIFGSPYAVAYSASKGGIVQLTKSLAISWARDNIQVNAILPGWFETEMTDRAKEQVPGLNERVLARVPVGRWGQPDDIAGTAVWLASRASDFVTGVAVAVDGGYSSAL